MVTAMHSHAPIVTKSRFRQSSEVIQTQSAQWAWQPLALLAAAVLLAGCEAKTAPATKSDRPVQVQQVVFESGARTRDFVGIVRARYETDLGFRVGGKIVDRPVNIGDRVRTGDIVARLDPQDLRLQVESAEAELAAAKSNLAQTAAEL
jgi:multidrug efflux pump subunit AcrA (membrane-fusion protein)